MKRLLLVVDMQKDFIDGSLGTEEARAIVPGEKKKVVKCQSEGWDVAFTLDTHGENYLDKKKKSHQSQGAIESIFTSLGPQNILYKSNSC